MNLKTRRFVGVLVLISTIGLSGCGVAKLWGGSDTPADMRQDLTLREQSAIVGEPMWEEESKGSWFGRIAGVLISGKEEADTATAAFELTGDEDDVVRQAASYLQDRREGAKDLSELASRVKRDAEQKNGQIEVFSQAAEQALKEVKSSVLKAQKANHWDALEIILENAERDRRAVIRAAKAIRQQRDVFAAARDLIADSDSNVDVSSLTEQIDLFETHSKSLDEIADELDFRS